MIDVEYPITNENLLAITRGLAISPSDDVLAICGSGDQAFALLENARSVLAMDKSGAQVEFAEKRRELLRQGKYDEFLPLWVDGYDLNPRPFHRRREYFHPERLERITSKVDNLEIVRGDIFNPRTSKKFSKIYLSNSLLYESMESSAALRRIVGILNFLSINGLLYISDIDDLGRAGIHSPLPSPELPFVSFDKEQTRVARVFERYEDWFPVVLRK